jgi:hypothetical protein
MAHFMECIDSKCLGALHFTDDKMQPKPRQMTIKSVQKGRPPAAGKSSAPKWCFYFIETDKGAFLSGKQVKAIANALMCADPNGWVGAKLTISCAETRYKGEPVMGMVVLKVTRKDGTDAPLSRVIAPANAQYDDTVDPSPEDDGRAT